jgi:hypothetical protein
MAPHDVGALVGLVGGEEALEERPAVGVGPQRGVVGGDGGEVGRAPARPQAVEGHPATDRGPRLL